MTTITRRSLLAASLLPWAAHGQGALAHRVALVIGNGAYPGPGALRNPTNDARAMSATLNQLGFTVIEVQDASRERMLAALGDARQALRGRDGIGMLYYAGHGLQLDWRNYMVPVNAQLNTAADVPRETLDVSQVLDTFREAGTKLNIVVLDACRNNPFPVSGAGRGLAQMDAPPGTFLAYATAPGHVALDGMVDDANGLYTRFLLDEIRKPGARIEETFKRVRLQVRQRSSGQQVPWESTSLEDDFVFNTGLKARNLTVEQNLDAFSQQKIEWDRIKDSRNPDDLYAFLKAYPTGLIAEQAQFRLDQLQKVAVAPQPLPGQPVALPSGVNRFVVGDGWGGEYTDRTTGTTRRGRFRVTRADDLRVEVNNGAMVLDQMGGVILNQFGGKDPAVLVAPADIAVGKRWRSAFVNTRPDGVRERNYYNMHVTALETITIPAGQFRAYRIEGRGLAQEGGNVTTLVQDYWIDPETMWAIQIDRKYTSNRAGVVEHSRSAVTGILRQPRNNT